MKQILLGLAVSAGFLFSANAQSDNIQAFVNGGNVDYSGSAIDTIFLYQTHDTVTTVYFVNNTGIDYDWIVSRHRSGEPSQWEDYICWGNAANEAGGGTCIGADLMDTDQWSFPAGGAVPVADGEYGFATIHIKPSAPHEAVATYRYFVGTAADPYMDTLDIIVDNRTSSIDNLQSLSLNVSPNPASNYVNVSAEGVNDASVKMIDVLGNVILTSEINGTKKIDVANFRNGIYFIIVEAPGVKTVNRKLVVRH